MKSHVHSEVIKAWADGAKIEYFDYLKGKWMATEAPHFVPHLKYRVVPAGNAAFPEEVYFVFGPNYRWGEYDRGVASSKDEADEMINGRNEYTEYVKYVKAS